MIPDPMQNKALQDGVTVMIELSNRDEAKTLTVMMELWAHSVRAGYTAVRWEIGFYNKRDLARAASVKDPKVKETRFMGVPVFLCGLADSVVLIAIKGGRETRLVTEDY